MKRKFQRKSKADKANKTVSRERRVKLKRPLKRAEKTEIKLKEAIQNVPRITNETVTEHREEVLSSARKFIYPLQRSRKNIVKISVTILVAVSVLFLGYTTLALYKLQTTSTLIYDVTRVLPFPVAKAGDSWVSYESYLFELRRNMHYYQTQQQADFSSPSSKEQLDRLKNQALDRVIKDAYVKKLAKQNDVSVSSRAVNNQVELVRSQNRLGNSNRVFKDVLSQFWGWTPDDFKRELRQEMLQQAVVAKLDTSAAKRAAAAADELKKGAEFATVAAKYSDDETTKAAGGVIANAITQNDRTLPPILAAEIFKLQQGQTSGVINTGYSLEIVRVLEATPTTRKIAHVQINLKNIETYIKPLQQKEPSKKYITIK